MNSEHLSAEEPRSTQHIIADLENLCNEEGFVYTFSFIVFTALWIPINKLAKINWHGRPNHQELSFLLGLMVKSPLNITPPKSEDTIRSQNNRVHNLLEELHRALSFTQPRNTEPSDPIVSIPQNATNEGSQSRIARGEGMIEPFFYGAEGASDHQFLDTAIRRYRSDSPWLAAYLGTDFNSIVELAKEMKHLQYERALNLDRELPLLEFSKQCFELFCFRPAEISSEGIESVNSFFEAFSLSPGRVNSTLNSVGAYNAIHSHPIVRLGSSRYYLPITFYLGRSIYESPFYWMMSDDTYRETALQNRGSATEEIVYSLLQTTFGQENVMHGAKVKKGGHDVTDIDVLAVFDNKAVVVQAKSKKLRISSRTGDGESIKADFREAVQSAYDQALLSKAALMDNDHELIDSSGVHPITVGNLDAVYILCVTGDHYPALGVQVHHHLSKSTDDPNPLALSVFDLEVMSHCLKDPYDYLYYLRQRTLHADRFAAMSELDLLSFHLACNLDPGQEPDFIFVSQDLSELIRADYLLSKGYWPQAHSTSELSFEWRDESFDQIIECVKETKVPGVTDAIFFLFDLASTGTESFIRTIAKLQRATLGDGRWHDVSMPIRKDRRGISFISYPMPSSAGELRMFYDHFQKFAMARKHKAYADEWIALASIVGTPKLIDMTCYSREPWQADHEMDDLSRVLLKPGKALNSTGRRPHRKPSRNQPCPCGSALKYKKCHGG